MFGRISYYIFVLPLSYLPLFLLYLITDVLYLFLITIVPYRNKVIETNIRNSFPHLNVKERKRIKRKFYRHFTDLLAESVKGLSISEEALRKRLIVSNPEIMQDLYSKKKNVILVSGHYNNWEWLVAGQGLLFKHAPVGIGMPMTSKFWDEKINERRSRFGMKVVHSKNYKNELKSLTNELVAVLLLADQSPGNSSKSYWMEFLNQPTAVLFGTELMAHEMNYSVVFFMLRKKSRGRYEMELSLITEEPKNTEWGYITKKHTQLLEQEICEQPYYWLWSHKRWKREVPTDLEELKIKQRERFNEKFHY